MTNASGQHTCRFCHARLSVDIALDGSSITCPSCQQTSWFSVDSSRAARSGRERFPQDQDAEAAR